MVETAKVKLVTVIASSELLDRLTEALRALGAAGYTTASVNGRGLHGTRKRSLFDSGNVRLETIALPLVAEKILEHVAMHYPGFEIVAFAQDVEAVPRANFS
ncbi:MAG: P-II family nitrogen regulator [Polyangiaceae bacterium]|jgi:nitrogen regulatory protein P-II 2